MYIDHQVKLDFKDVLIRPKRSTLRSRSDVSLLRHYRFLHAQKEWEGVPVIAANMDHTGTFAMACALSKYQMMTALSKFATVEEWQYFAKANPDALPFAFVSSGSRDGDFENLKAIMAVMDVPFICLDVANGYSQAFVDFVCNVREAFPDKIIMAGNVVTGEMTEELTPFWC